MDHRSAVDEGSSLVGLLAVVAVLGVVAAVAFSQLDSTTIPTVPTTSIRGTTTTTSGSTTHPTVPTDVDQALVAECDADYAALAAALDDYEALNGGPPAAGTAWATSRDRGGPYLQRWPTGLGRFTIRWSGSALVVAPTGGRASTGSAGTSSPRSGCDAL